MSKNGNKSTQKKPAETEAALPLFFSNPAMIHPSRHAKAGIRAGMKLDFARQTNSVPINAVEIPEAAKHYPVVFTLDETPMPTAVLGLEKENYYIDEKGDWREDSYIPAYVRKYPFIFSEVAGGQLTLCVDEAAPQFTQAGAKDVQDLYDDQNQPTQYTRNALAFCQAFQEEYLRTQRFSQLLKEMDLLVPQRSNATLAQGRAIQLGGFQIIDGERFQKLGDEKIASLHRQGWLPLMHAALFSNSNWKRLLDMASRLEAAKKQGNPGPV